jgi:hypothetical protein
LGGTVAWTAEEANFTLRDTLVGCFDGTMGKGGGKHGPNGLASGGIQGGL